MIGEILNRHRDGTLEGGIPNPSLGDICQLVSKAAASITPNVQRRAFTNTGLTLPVDGSEDGALSPELKKLFAEHGQDLLLRPDDLARFSSTEPASSKPAVSKIFEVLCGDAQNFKQEEFSLKPKASLLLKKREQRWARKNGGH